MTSLKNLTSDTLIPNYKNCLTDSIYNLEDGRLLATVKIKGINYMVAKDSKLKEIFNTQKNFFNALSNKFGGHLAIWTHIIKKKDSLKTKYSFSDNFMSALSEKYCEQFNQDSFYTVDYFITFVLKSKTMDDGILDLTEILNSTCNIYEELDCKALSISNSINGIWNCDNLSFLGYLFNHYDPQIPLSSERAIYSISRSNLHFGYDTFEIRNNNSTDSVYGVSYEMNNYGKLTEQGMWDYILNVSGEFILTQSMVLMTNSKAKKLIEDQENLVKSSKGSTDDLAEISLALDGVKSDQICFGDYHASLIAFGDTESEAIDFGNALSGTFIKSGSIWSRTNLDSIFTFQSIMPGSTIRPLSSPRTITNLMCGFSLHNYAQGKATGNPIGDGLALLPLKTVTNSIYNFNCHYTKDGVDTIGEPVAGHTLILGETGSGKTTLEAFITGFFTRYDPAIFAIDYNRSTELYIRAFKGEYFILEDGKYTGINPFQFKETNELKGFLNGLVCTCAKDNKPLSAHDELEIKDAIDSVLLLDKQHRRFSTLLQFITNDDLRIRLSKWCASVDGQYAWALDSEVNKFDPETFYRIAFDTTFIFKKQAGEYHKTAEPLLFVLMYMKEQMQPNGRNLISIFAEFWMPANFGTTQELMKQILKAGRLKYEHMILSSQSPEDAIKCEIFDDIVQSTPTKILLANPDGDPESYKRIKLTDKEIEGVLSLSRSSRQFLVKQGDNSVFAKLDLTGFDDFLPILSGTKPDTLLCNEIIKVTKNNDPNFWIPLLIKCRKYKKDKHQAQYSTSTLINMVLEA